MERRKTRAQGPQAASGEFLRARPMSEPVRKEPEGPLVLDFTEFDEIYRRQTSRPPDPSYGEKEPDTARYTYITSIGQLRALLDSAVAFVREGAAEFDSAAFAARISSFGMCTRDKDEPYPYYFIEDDLGRQFRLYVEPAGNISSKMVQQEKRVVLDMGGKMAYLFPVAFQNDERR